MKKLFLYDSKRSDIYLKQLKLAYSLVQSDLDVKFIDMNNIKHNYLGKFDVIISNSLPDRFKFFAKKNKIILIYFDITTHYHMLRHLKSLVK